MLCCVLSTTWWCSLTKSDETDKKKRHGGDAALERKHDSDDGGDDDERKESEAKKNAAAAEVERPKTPLTLLQLEAKKLRASARSAPNVSRSRRCPADDLSQRFVRFVCRIVRLVVDVCQS